MKWNIKHTANIVGTVPKSNRKILERGKTIPLMHTWRSLRWIVTDISTTIGIVELVLGAQTFIS